MGQFGIGQPVRRKEDERFLRGQGSYLDDIALDGQAYAVVVRSPYAHAEIKRIDVEPARQSPGVLAVFTGHDLEAAGIRPLPCLIDIGTELKKPPRHALQTERVRHVGDPVAFVVADSLAAARDAAELVEVDYDGLAAVTEAVAALGDDAPQLWPEAPHNQAFHFKAGDRQAVADAFARAAHVTRLELINNRVVVAPMETRGAIAAYDADDDRLTLHLSGQGAHNLKSQIASHVLGIEPDRLRLIVPDVGGGFGVKNFLYPEYVLLLFAARELGRPVRWVAERSEDFQSASQGRDQVTKVALALDAEHRILGLEIDTVANLGAHLSTNAPLIPTRASMVVTGGCYKVPAIDFQVRGVFTNTVPVDAYRGAGRPEAAYIIERLIEQAAHELKLDPAELRRRNFIEPADMPYKTALGQTLDCGDFAGTMDKALALADRDGFQERRRASEARGRLRGLGMAHYYEATLGPPQEAADLRFEDDGRVTLYIGTQSNGQGLETGFAQILNEALSVPFEKMRMVQGDTTLVPTGGGHGGSRSIQLGGSALFRGAEETREKGKELAAEDLEAAIADIEFHDGTYRVVGTDRAIGLFELAAKHRENGRSLLDARAQYEREAFTFPNGCHVVEVEIDPDTGTVTVERYAVCDDFGRVINPLLAEGQVHGGIAQGIGQALLERTVYEPDTGQLLSASFMDYTMPRAWDVGHFAFALNEVPTTTNPLGVKGCGEAGCVGALPAVMNAVIDALRPRGIDHVDMPATPETIWRLLNPA